MRKGTATDMNTPNERGLTQNQLNDVIVQTCQALDVEYYDWRKQPIITKDNAFWTLGDGASGVHPTAKTSLENRQTVSIYIEWRKKIDGRINYITRSRYGRNRAS